MDIHHLRYFLAVCETLNFTKAADNCHVSQPALSRAIQQLEQEVGGLLFRRERNLTHITDLGMLLKPHFESIISELGTGEAQRQAVPHSRTGKFQSGDYVHGRSNTIHQFTLPFQQPVSGDQSPDN
ncbi:MAG: LysR family transcriptional regulator [Rhodospirillales bacterium]|nr:LysR family transcriptional regulator [Rhodospirillales bacterium]